jgi:hypothetical protein
MLRLTQSYKLRSVSTLVEEEPWEKEIYTTAPIDKVQPF